LRRNNRPHLSKEEKQFHFNSRIVFVFDEAQEFIPAEKRKEDGTDNSSRAVERLSRHGRKYKFFSDVEQQYDDKLGFEANLQNSKSEIEKNELIKLQLTILTAWFNSIILSQLEQIQQVSSFVEFGPLVKAAKGQKVPINHLKSAVIKALDILISSDPTLSIGMVKTTRQFLEDDIRKSGNIAP
jgi:hypothetical protein